MAPSEVQNYDKHSLVVRLTMCHVETVEKRLVCPCHPCVSVLRVPLHCIRIDRIYLNCMTYSSNLNTTVYEFKYKQNIVKASEVVQYIQ